MASPFPGMDPYLEHREHWHSFHTELAVGIKHHLNLQLDPKYFAEIEVQYAPNDLDLQITNQVRPDVSIYEPIPAAPEPFSGVATMATFTAPSVVLTAPLTIRLRSVRVYRTETRELVTSIELLSPYNKRVGSSGITEYRLKRAQILASHVHLVEIDLLRGGERPGLEFIDEPIETDYILLVNRFRLLERLSEIWPVALNEPLPLIPVPLLSPDPDIPLDLKVIIDEIYTSSRYSSRLQYRLPLPPPPLRPEMQDWVEKLLTERTKSRTM